LIREEENMRTISVMMLAISVAGAASVSAQSTASAQPHTQALRAAWDGARKNIVESSTIMEEANYAFKPVDTVRTFGQILGHVAGANYVICSAAKGEKPPHTEDAFEKLATKAEIVKAVADSMAYCDSAMAGATDATLGETIDMPFGMGKAPRAAAVILNTNHLNEHYGNLVTYFRIKGIVPPSSR
jgi:uncharacterized damage-inducible protein DinB